LGKSLELGEIERSKELDRISRYAPRIQRDLHSNIKLLQTLQSERKIREQAALEQAALLQKFFEMTKEPWTPAEFGFVLTPAEISAHIHLNDSLDRAKLGKTAHFDLANYQTASKRAFAD
jgi:hypothetical protein